MANLRKQADMHQLNCVRCCDPFKGKRRDAKYCGATCARRAYSERRIADGRLAQQRLKHATARASYQATYVRQTSCAACGLPVHRRPREKTRRPACSEWCKGYLRTGFWPQTEVPSRHPIRSTPVPREHPARSAQCARCTVTFVIDYVGQIYCTRRCHNRAHTSRRDARKRGQFVADVHPQYIYERDRWICHLCRKKIRRIVEVPHPKAPTIDHVIPLAAGGTHEPANVRAAHFICNVMKQHRGGGEQLALIG